MELFKTLLPKIFIFDYAISAYQVLPRTRQNTDSKICIMALQVLALKIAGSYLYR
ncbi:hypothetical protein [Helicobacter bilis]|uniref:hypothetical protein n=1 Tax=Helicobacter bilis TaxID=37372 RepID=UPI00248F425B|nr:hypothetical protein [Helicobacter bilis]